jgi:4-hydroxythreonine-4-phosphate dehydrogenase
VVSPPRLAVTSGEPAGIGPDICLKLADDPPAAAEIVILGDPTLLAARGERLGRRRDLPAHDPAAAPVARRVSLCAETLGRGPSPGQPEAANASYVLNLLRRAADGCQTGEFDAMITAPVHKGIINDAGIAFSGHTEFLAERTGANVPVMMLATDTLRVALATTHLPLAGVPGAITAEHLSQVLTVLDGDLRKRFAVVEPRILVCGLNPHAGEGGHLGREEIDIIEPCLDEARAREINVLGPLPADTLFTPRHLEGADAVLAMYHDQGLPVLKYAGFGHAVNVTLGLPIVRTSVDHGTAFDLAATGDADAGSLRAAIDMALDIVKRASRPRKHRPRKIAAEADRIVSARNVHRPRKRFGQHFLHDPATIDKIVDAIAPEPKDRLIEIGPGLGALTRPLLERAGVVDVIELDRDVIPKLESRCANAGGLTIHQQDALKMDVRALAGSQRARLVGNLPYNISTPLLFHLLSQADAIDDMHFMLQREVVDRICAPPGTRTYGRLTIMAARLADAERLFTVGAGAFTPPPAVESAVVRLVPRRFPPFAYGSSFDAIVAGAFSKRRKTLRNALKRIVSTEAIEAAEIDPGARPETLSPKEFGRLSLMAARDDEAILTRKDEESS